MSAKRTDPVGAEFQERMSAAMSAFSVSCADMAKGFDLFAQQVREADRRYGIIALMEAGMAGRRVRKQRLWAARRRRSS